MLGAIAGREVGVAVDDHAALKPPHDALRPELLLAERQADLDAEPAEEVAGFVSIGRINERGGKVPRDPGSLEIRSLTVDARGRLS